MQLAVMGMAFSSLVLLVFDFILGQSYLISFWDKAIWLCISFIGMLGSVLPHVPAPMRMSAGAKHISQLVYLSSVCIIGCVSAACMQQELQGLAWPAVHEPDIRLHPVGLTSCYAQPTSSAPPGRSKMCRLKAIEVYPISSFPKERPDWCKLSSTH